MKPGKPVGSVGHRLADVPQSAIMAFTHSLDLARRQLITSMTWPSILLKYSPASERHGTVHHETDMHILYVARGSQHTLCRWLFNVLAGQVNKMYLGCC